MAHLIEEVTRSCRPIFISQHGYLTAILMSCDGYDGLLGQLRALQHTERRPRLRRVEPVPKTLYGPYDFETAQLFELSGYATELDEIPEEWLPDD
jgi:hypothetical protein